MYLGATAPMMSMPPQKGVTITSSTGIMPDDTPVSRPVLYAGYSGGYTGPLPFAKNEPTPYAPPAPEQPVRTITKEVLKYLPSPLPVFQMPHPSSSSLMTGGEDVGGNTPFHDFYNPFRSDDNPNLAGLGETPDTMTVLLLAGIVLLAFGRKKR